VAYPLPDSSGISHRPSAHCSYQSSELVARYFARFTSGSVRRRFCSQPFGQVLPLLVPAFRFRAFAGFNILNQNQIY
jgi:hypothetical protein